MSKDIRSFFLPKKAAKPKLEDEDVIPESPEVSIKNKKKETKKKRVLIDDSDEEIFSIKKKKDDKESTSSKGKKPVKPALTEVKPADLFGGPIKRTEPLVKKKKKTETGIHSDDEFEKSLLEIDNAELEQLNDSKISNETPPKEKNSNTEKSSSKSEKTSASKDVTSPKYGSSSKDALSPKNASSSKDALSPKNTASTKEKTKDASPDKKHKHTHSETNKDNKSEDHKSKRDKKQNQSVSSGSNGDKKSKIDNSKRKFAEFIDDDGPQDQGSGKKKKPNENHEETEKKPTKSDDMNDSKVKSVKKEHNSSVEDMEVDDKGSTKKKKFNKSLNESVLTDEERHERKIASAALYKSYLNRSGPKQLGAKEMPEGTPDCLKNCAFVLTGVLDSFEKEEVTAAINKFGGCVKSGVTKKVTHILAGEDAGPAKMAKAQELGIKIINEDEFLKMITDNSKKKHNSKADKVEIKKERSPHKSSSKDKDKIKDKSPKDKEKDKKDNHVDSKSKKSPSETKIKTESKSRESSSSSKHKDPNEGKHRDKSKSPKKKEDIKSEPKSEKKSPADCASSSKSTSQMNGTAKPVKEIPANMSMWVEKYKPQNIKQIIGQHGDASNVKKLINWLTKWYVNRKAKLAKPSPWAKNDDGGYYKAALLSGPPGVGKTTTVSLVCKELGFDVVEFNASDTRNKTLIKEQIGELLTTTSLSGYAKGETGKQAVTKKHVLVMDEVDGMAGNEDRGGLQELISLIKSASVPIICMCNDRNSQKMRSLVNYCYDLRFNRPRVDQIKSAMLSICFKEGIKIPPDVLSQLITSANQDVRQTLNLLSMWAVDPTRTDAERLRKDAQVSKKDIKLGPWEAIRKVFSAEDHKTMSINDKSDLFFYDYSLAPLFVQENYLQVVPKCPKHEVLQRISAAADSISLGDMVDARIRGRQAWSLLPLQAMYASVIPGHELSGHVSGQIQFPGWLGKNSRATKMKRLCQEIHAHTRLSTSGSKSSIYLDYASHIRDAIVNPLIKDRADGIDKSLEVLESYHLLREDLDSLVELSVWPGQRNPTVLIDSKVKAAMTRTYNKKASALPFAPGAVKRGRARDDDAMEGDEEQEDEEPPDSDPENDAFIKKNPTKVADKPGPSKKAAAKPSTSKKKKGT